MTRPARSHKTKLWHLLRRQIFGSIGSQISLPKLMKQQSQRHAFGDHYLGKLGREAGSTRVHAARDGRCDRRRKSRNGRGRMLRSLESSLASPPYCFLYITAEYKSIDAFFVKSDSGFLFVFRSTSLQARKHRLVPRKCMRPTGGLVELQTKNWGHTRCPLLVSPVCALPKTNKNSELNLLVALTRLNQSQLNVSSHHRACPECTDTISTGVKRTHTSPCSQLLYIRTGAANEGARCALIRQNCGEGWIWDVEGAVSEFVPQWQALEVGWWEVQRYVTPHKIVAIDLGAIGGISRRFDGCILLFTEIQRNIIEMTLYRVYRYYISARSTHRVRT